VLNTDPARTHYYLGLVYEAQKRPDKALEHYRKALERLLGERP
jgi:tetratricopeptide (TPR) repeat protein